MLLPYDNLPEAAVVTGLRLLPVRTLREAVERLNQRESDWPADEDFRSAGLAGLSAEAAAKAEAAAGLEGGRASGPEGGLDLSELHGQKLQRRAVTTC